MNPFEAYLSQHNKSILPFLQSCLQEDIGEGDHTSLACVPGENQK